MRARDPFRLIVWESRFRQARTLKAYPRPEALSRIVAPIETQASTGSEVARVKGDGIEYADIRDFVSGDRVRAINWRASARRGELVVNERHPERNTDVVLFVDSFTDVRGDGRSTLDDAVRASAALASRYLERRDRVGLIAFGGILRWLRPGMGHWQRVMLIETLLETGIQPTYTWREVSGIPARILPTKALVFAITPLVDARFVRSSRGPARPRFRPGRGRGRPGRIRRAGPRRDRAARLPALDPRARDAPRAARAPRRRCGALGRRRLARGRARGGEGIQALRQARADVVIGAGAVGCAVALAALPLARADEEVVFEAGYRVAAFALLALVAALVLEQPWLIPVSLVSLGGLYGVQLAVDDVALDSAAALVAAGLLVTAELAYWSLEERERVKDEPGESLRRLAFVALFGLGALVVSALLLGLVDAVGTAGLAVDLVGAAAAAAALLAVVLAARARERDRV